MTALNGALIRKPDGWYWTDTNEPATSVKDLTLTNCYNFKIRNYSNESYVEVPVCYAQASSPRQEPELAFAEQIGKRDKSVYLVPTDVWDTKSKLEPIGATWDKTDEPGILARANFQAKGAVA